MDSIHSNAGLWKQEFYYLSGTVYIIRNQSKYINNGRKRYKILYKELLTFKLKNLLHTMRTNCFPLVLAHQPINTCLSIISTNTNTGKGFFELFPMDTYTDLSALLGIENQSQIHEKP